MIDGVDVNDDDNSAASGTAGAGESVDAADRGRGAAKDGGMSARLFLLAARLC